MQGNQLSGQIPEAWVLPSDLQVRVTACCMVLLLLMHISMGPAALHFLEPAAGFFMLASVRSLIGLDVSERALHIL